MLDIAYCDDVLSELESHSRLVKTLFELNRRPVQIDQYTESSELMKRVAGGTSYDVLFLDIDMPEINGLEAGKWLRDKMRDAIIVFVSSHDEFVFETFQARPFRFIRKSKFVDGLEEAVPAIVKELLYQSSEVTIQVGKEIHVLHPDRIIYVESMGKTLTLFTEQGSVQYRYKMMDLEDALAPYGFIRVHKGYLVNGRYLSSIGTDAVILQNGVSLPMSKQRKQHVIQRLEELL